MFMSCARALGSRVALVRAFGIAAPLLVSVSACDGLDVTHATGLPDAAVAQPEPVPVVEPRESAAGAEDAGTPEAPPDPHTPVSQTGETPLTPVAPDGPHDTVTPPPPVELTPDAGTSGPEPVALDCSALPEAPLQFESLEGFTSSEDFVFDAEGNYVGVDDNTNLVRISKTGEKQLWAPSIGNTAGMGMLPDGSVVFCALNQGAIKRAYPNGSVVVVLGGLLYPNGLDIGPDGFIYVAENSAGRVRRIDPDTGEFSIVALGLEGPNGVAFSNDPGLLYVGSFEGSGVYKIEIDTPGQLGRASVFARPAGSRLLDPVVLCPDREEGVDCDSPYYLKSKCQALANAVDCMPVDPCADLADEEYCDFPSPGGVCKSGRCEALPDPCAGLGDGDACEDTNNGITGTCKNTGGVMYCSPPNDCEDKQAGDACEDYYAGPGQCVRNLDALYCEAQDPCEAHAAGDACEDYYAGPGTCQAYGDKLYCEAVNPCDGQAAGDTCEDFASGSNGICHDLDGYLYCVPPNVCDDLTVGDACEDPNSGVAEGTCQAYADIVYCGLPNVCDDLAVGDACEDPNSGVPEGTCQLYGEVLYCSPPSTCDGLAEGDTCQDDYFGEGVCQAQEDSPLYCGVPNACIGLAEGDRCQDAIGAGTCLGGYCNYTNGGGGGIDGLGVDACGNVYASEYTDGNLWRITPAGEIELAAVLPSFWIPNIKWGRGVGGFSKSVMYVANRDNAGLFGVEVGVPGVTEFHDLVSP
jgi:sugar lactone lactonase YvrE